MTQYAIRKAKNEDSRRDADKDREFWTPEEVVLLEENWNTTPLEEIAVRLGRTIEACRQKHYMLEQRGTRAVAPVTQWAKGFTSLEDMGY